MQFKSTYFTSEEVDPSSQHACDTVYDPRAVQPALLYWQRTADPENHFESSLYRWPGAMEMMTNTLLQASHLTEDDAYLEPIRTMAAIRADYLEDPPENPEPGSAMWCAAGMGGFLSETLGKYRLLTGDEQFDALLLADANGYVQYRLTGGEQILLRAFEEAAGAFRVNRAGYMEEVRWTDRVFRFHANYANDYADPLLLEPALNFLYVSVTGDFGSPLYFPMNAVRWRTPPLNIAALVTDHDTAHLSTELYHFSADSRPMSAEFYLLDPGIYEWRLEAEDAPFVEEPRTSIDFVLPPRRFCTLRVNCLIKESRPKGSGTFKMKKHP